MCKYKRGDVVWVLCPFTDGSGFKHRPCIISKIQSLVQDCRYFIIECSSLKDKHSKQRGIIIKENHSEYNNLGFEEDTFITETRTWILERFLKPPPTKKDNPIGACNFINTLDPL